MNYPDRAEGVVLVTDYPVVDVQRELALKALEDLIEERDLLLDRVAEISIAIRNIKRELADG